MAPTNTDVPACPECGAMTYELEVFFVGTISWDIDPTGWHREGHSPDDGNDVRWRIACLGCSQTWEVDEPGNPGQELYNALERDWGYMRIGRPEQEETAATNPAGDD